MTDIVDRALLVATKEEAAAFIEEMAAEFRDATRGPVPTGVEESHRICRKNLAFYAGFRDIDTRRKLEQLFDAVHPVLGPVPVKEGA